MAQPPDITETFVREVDENLRRDRIHEFFQKNGSLLIAAVVLFLAICGALIWYQQHREQRSQAEVERLAQIYKDIGDGNTAKVPQQLEDLSQAGSKAVRASALFTRAALALQQNDPKTATTIYRELSDDSSLPEAYRNAALIRDTAVEFDQLQPGQIISRMEPLAKPGNAWFGSAGEMTAIALMKEGKSREAGEMFAAIARDKSVPDSIRNRAIQISGSLGADASAALGPQAQ